MVRVIGVGDNTVDKYLHLRQMFPGGNAVNVAVLAHRYGHPASYIGWFGNDRYGDLLLDALENEKIDTTHCRIVDGPNAHGDVSLIDGERVFGHSDHGVTTLIALTEEDLEFISQHQLTHTSIYSYIESDIQKLSEASTCLSFDFSQDWTREYLSEILPWVHIAILSYPDCSEAETEDLMSWIYNQGPKLVLVTQGKLGAVLFDGISVSRQGILETNVVDTLGAGDAFAARFLVEYLEGTSVEMALQKAAISAAETCGYYGAFEHGVAY